MSYDSVLFFSVAMVSSSSIIVAGTAIYINLLAQRLKLLTEETNRVSSANLIVANQHLNILGIKLDATNRGGAEKSNGANQQA